jgi:hypothetical protein
METEKLKHSGMGSADQIVNQLLEQFQDSFISVKSIQTSANK